MKREGPENAERLDSSITLKVRTLPALGAIYRGTFVAVFFQRPAKSLAALEIGLFFKENARRLDHAYSSVGYRIAGEPFPNSPPVGTWSGRRTPESGRASRGDSPTHDAKRQGNLGF